MGRVPDLGNFLLNMAGQINQQTAQQENSRYRQAQTINLLEAHREKLEIGKASQGLNMADYEDKEPGAYWKDVAKNIKNPMIAQKVYKTGQDEMNSASKEMVGLIKDTDQETRDMLLNSPKNKWFRNKLGLEEGKIANFNPDKQKFDLEGVEISEPFNVQGIDFPPGKHNLTLKGPVFKVDTTTGQRVFQPQNVIGVKEPNTKGKMTEYQQTLKDDRDVRAIEKAERDDEKRNDKIRTDFDSIIEKVQARVDAVDKEWDASQAKNDPKVRMTQEEYDRRIKGIRARYNPALEQYRKHGLWHGWEKPDSVQAPTEKTSPTPSVAKPTLKITPQEAAAELARRERERSGKQ
jgi:hypothetical protein